MSNHILANYLDLASLAQELDLHPRTLMRWIEQPNGLPCTKLGRRILFNRDSVQNWIAAQERKPPASRRSPPARAA
jgi:excisionase family DNA binding protein